jgi:CubicO group peptidase (beta-lactamase class C family)
MNPPGRDGALPVLRLRRRWNTVAASLLAALALLAVPGAGAGRDGEAQTERNDGPGPFSEAMARHAPLQRVEGSNAPPLCAEAPASSVRYGSAMSYAEATGSYSLLIWRAGRCELAHYFAPHDASLRPESASMHKTVVALLLAAAIADGHVESADDPVGRYLHEWKGDPRGEIALRDILTMASGLAPFSRDGGVDSPGWRYVTGNGNARQATLARPLVREPGSLFHYSGFNTQLLLMVIEAATGRSYGDYLRDRLWQPLGASDAYLFLYDEEPPMARAYSALMTTADSWLRVGLLLKDRGVFGGERLLPAALVDEMTSPSRSNANYGWQLWLGNEYEPVRYYNRQQTGAGMRSAEPFAVDDMIYLDGIGGQRVYVSRSEDLVIVRLGDMRLDWDDTHLPNLVLRAAAEPGR